MSKREYRKGIYIEQGYFGGDVIVHLRGLGTVAYSRYDIKRAGLDTPPDDAALVSHAISTKRERLLKQAATARKTLEALDEKLSKLEALT